MRKTANGPLLRLDYDISGEKYTLPTTLGDIPEVVKPESYVTLEHSLALLDGVWLPMPFLRFNPPRTFMEGPDNWSRVQIRRLAQPDQAGNTHRITLAFDTRLSEADNAAVLAPVPDDVRNGTRFTLAWRASEVGYFLDQT